MIGSALPVLGPFSDKTDKTLSNNIETSTNQLPGVTFYQVDYRWEHLTFINSDTGEIVVDIETLKAATGLVSGYLNVHSARG
jgi:hypothetical protein